MPRYPVRPWFHPLQFMGSYPHCYPFMVGMMVMTGLFPYRYHIARYYERQKDTTGQYLRGKTVRIYREIERMYRREFQWRNMVNEDQRHTRISLFVQQSSFMLGQTDAEFQYWQSHQRDVMRAKKLQEEIASMKARGVEYATTEDSMTNRVM